MRAITGLLIGCLLSGIATPSIFVNGRPLRSRHLERDLQRLINGA